MTNENDELARLIPRPTRDPKTEVAPGRQSTLRYETDTVIEDRFRTGSPVSQPVASLLSRLEHVQSARGGSLVAKCPAHVDQVPSLSISEGRDGRALVHCFAGCDTAAVLAAIGLSFSDLFVERW